MKVLGRHTINHDMVRSEVIIGEIHGPEIIDRRALRRLRKLGGDGLIRRMIDLFLIHATQKLDEAGACWANGQMKGVARAAHSLKSSAGNLGVQEVIELAESTEHTATNGDREQVGPLLEKLGGAFSRARISLEKVRKELAE